MFSLLKLFKSSSVIFTLVVFLLSGCTGGRNNGTGQLSELKIAVFQLYTSGLIVATDQSTKIDPSVNCFAQAGLKPIIIKRSKGPEIVDALVGGSAEIGTLAITPQALQVLQGIDLTVFATIQTTDRDIKVVGHRSSGIDSGASLKGKRVGYVGGTFGEIFLSRYLAKHGLDKSDISLVSSGPAQLRDLFLSKSLDAIIIWEPIIQDILNDESVNSDDIFLDVDTTIYTARMNLLARPEILKEKQQEAEKLVQALVCGEELMQKYPEKTRQVVEEWLDRRANTLIKVFDEKTFRLQLDVPALLSDLKEETKWAKEAVFNGKGDIPNDFTKLVDPSIMKAVNPKAVKK